ncbi:hypothetical protein CEV32_4200 [Brucella rhizosphaerae]|uniref:Uncharacterized protein n=1 Tax=Brucella rhizosphaerae TaxID=571254 RepID=A0A256FP06_9HYPH|nr:hypothetical protein CEV32_4200 [Brucella rhizosphaerae]
MKPVFLLRFHFIQGGTASEIKQDYSSWVDKREKPVGSQ